MVVDDSLWPDPKDRPRDHERYYIKRKYLRAAVLFLGAIHIFRHSAAKLRRDAGETVEEVSQFLDHSSLAVTTTYLRRLEGQEDKSWDKVADAIGL